MAHRGIASQSEYNPKLLNEFRQRIKEKEIQPSMKYSNRKECPSAFSHKKSLSLVNKNKESQNKFGS